MLQHSLLAFKAGKSKGSEAFSEAESTWAASGLVAAVLVFPIAARLKRFLGHTAPFRGLGGPKVHLDPLRRIADELHKHITVHVL